MYSIDGRQLISILMKRTYSDIGVIVTEDLKWKQQCMLQIA